ncbi:DUF2971 domain-containing protein [Bradyrhizobium sp. Pa8]|uniref:DUF2971 domain-containing protein n=1 Tax=Bradyrhizobium sp. Pa8 TaxID=3386552 RepID=UPI00403F038B
MNIFERLRAYWQVRSVYGAGVLPRPRPTSLFRCRNVENLEHLKAILIGHGVYAAPVGEGGTFNDPCECFYDIDLSWDEAGARDLIRHLKNQALTKINPTVRTTILSGQEIKPHEINSAEQALIDQDEETLVRIMRDGHRAMTPNIIRSLEDTQKTLDQITVGICCLTEHGTSPYMSWYYGGYHAGLCLEFSTAYPPFNNTAPVMYSSKPPKLKILGNPFKAQIARMQTKATVWKHEREWRLFSHPSTGLSLPFPPEALRSVSFGPYMKRSDEGAKKMQAILDILRERQKTSGQPLAVFQFEVDRSQYEFTKRPIEL